MLFLNSLLVASIASAAALSGPFAPRNADTSTRKIFLNFDQKYAPPVSLIPAGNPRDSENNTQPIYFNNFQIDSLPLSEPSHLGLLPASAPNLAASSFRARLTNGLLNLLFNPKEIDKKFIQSASLSIDAVNGTLQLISMYIGAAISSALTPIPVPQNATFEFTGIKADGNNVTQIYEYKTKTNDRPLQLIDNEELGEVVFKPEFVELREVLVRIISASLTTIPGGGSGWGGVWGG
ncbi:uncharacterized protein N0V89_007813 [Didymosphaeria variabile]|uniref:Uncharacterized protein n=1 Tax=Didymosphaeria variabile TaxID=1932322 RepID=A0A9W9CAK3_9PLEO|nr:uncharacterized protein N0V89_007813 [Didymosphaeria variabile]KAJ4352465.1 hypothetical protein N0V89_007813 [Didymosphaeria variabile]